MEKEIIITGTGIAAIKGTTYIFREPMDFAKEFSKLLEDAYKRKLAILEGYCQQLYHLKLES